MKLKTARSEDYPVYGDRSIGYFGIAALMDQEYFNTTRDRLTGPARPDPRIRYFCPKEQMIQRSQLIDAGIRFKRSMEEIEDEWRKCLKSATNAATGFIKGISEIESLGYIPHNPEFVKYVKSAYKVGRRVLEGEVTPRLARIDEWMTPIFPEFDFGNNTGELIYVRRQIIHSKETKTRKAYKIGRSRKFKRRNQSHRTENSDTEVVMTIDASSYITETAIHDLFKDHRFDGEWFLLSDEDIATLKDRSRLSAAIARMEAAKHDTPT